MTDLQEVLRTGPFRLKSVRNVSILTVANVAGAALNFIQGVVAARLLGPESYGLAALVMSFPSLVFTFFDARSTEATVKYVSEFLAGGDRDRALAVCKLGFAVDAAIGLLAFLASVFLASWAASHVVHRPDCAGLLVLYSAAYLPQALAGTSCAVLGSTGRFAAMARVRIITAVIRTLLVLGLVLGGLQASGVVIGNALAMALDGFLYGLFAWFEVFRPWGVSPWNGDWGLLKGRYREIFRFLAYSDVNALVGMLPKQLDVVLLGYFHGPETAGYYKLAKRLSGAVAYLVEPLQSVIYPELVRTWEKGDRAAIRSKIRRQALHAGIPFGFLVLLSVFPMPFIMRYVFGQEYAAAILPTQALIVGSAVWLAFFWLRPLYMTQGRVKGWANINIVVACISLLGFVLITPSMGAAGMAVWVMLMTVLAHAVAAFCIRQSWN